MSEIFCGKIDRFMTSEGTKTLILAFTSKTGQFVEHTRHRVFFYLYFFLRDIIYVGHPISSDIGLISQKLILESELYYPLHVAMGVAYSCLKYEAFITT